MESFLKYIDMMPLWLWQISGAFFITLTVMQTIKSFEPITWSPYKRRQINRLLSMLIGGGSILWLYNNEAKEFVVVAFIVGNSYVYDGLVLLISRKAATNNGIWTFLLGIFKPHKRRAVKK